MKNKYIVSVIVCVATILVTLFSLTACVKPKENNTLQYQVAYAASFNENTIPFNINLDALDPSSTKNIREIINSFEGLTAVSAENNYPFFNEEDINYNSDISKKIREYDNDYFADNAILLLIRFDNPFDQYTFDNLSIKNNNLVVTLSKLDRDYEYDTPAVVAAYAYVFELSKDDIKNISDIVIEKIHK